MSSDSSESQRQHGMDNLSYLDSPRRPSAIETASNALHTARPSNPTTISTLTASLAIDVDDSTSSATQSLEAFTASLKDAISELRNMIVTSQPNALEAGSHSLSKHQISHVRDVSLQLCFELKDVEAAFVVMGPAGAELQYALEATRYAIQQLLDIIPLEFSDEEGGSEAAAENTAASNIQTSNFLSLPRAVPASNGTSHQHQELGNPSSLMCSPGGLNQSGHISEKPPIYSLLKDGSLQLPREEILTRDFVIVRADGSHVPASGRFMRRLLDRSVVGFELPPRHDSIYHLLVDPSRMDVLKCGICFDELSRVDFSNIDCQCVCCNKCLNEILRHALTTRSQFPPRCFCGQEIDLSYLDPILDKDIPGLRTAIPEDWMAANPTYCARSGCGAFIPAARFESEHNSAKHFGVCMVCEEKTCSKCKQIQTAHNGLCGKCPRQNVPEELYAFIKSQQLTRCPDCKVLVELVEGCNHVCCNCGCNFCFECGACQDDCDCPESMADGYNLQDVESHTWSTSAHGLEAEVEIRSWPKHEKVIVAGTTHAEEDDISGCEHLQVIAATGKARCHGCLQILDFLNRCSECGIELCDFCRPKSLD